MKNNNINFPIIKQAALIPVTGVFAYAILDVLFVLDGFRSAHFSNEEKKVYASVISIFSILFIYSAFSEYRRNYTTYNISLKKNARRDERIKIYKQELIRNNNDMKWEYLPFNLKKDITNIKTPNKLLEHKVKKIFPRKNHIDIDYYLFLSWERHVAKKKLVNKMIHYENSMPLLHADYALLTMFSIDFNLSIWCLNAFNKPKLEYPIIFLSGFIFIMLIGSKTLSWIHDKNIIDEKSKFRKNKFRKIQHLLDQYKISNPDEALVFIESTHHVIDTNTNASCSTSNQAVADENNSSGIKDGNELELGLL